MKSYKQEYLEAPFQNKPPNCVVSYEMANVFGVDNTIVLTTIIEQSKMRVWKGESDANGQFWLAISDKELKRYYFPFWRKDKILRIINLLIETNLLFVATTSGGLYQPPYYLPNYRIIYDEIVKHRPKPPALTHTG